MLYIFIILYAFCYGWEWRKELSIRPITIILLISSGFILTGCLGAGTRVTPTATLTLPPPTEAPVTEVTVGDPKRGRLSFQNGGAEEASTWYGVFWADCHIVDGSREKIHRGPELQCISVQAEETVPGLTAAQSIYQSIMDPRAYVVENIAFISLSPRRLFSEEEVADLVAFLLA